MYWRSCLVLVLSSVLAGVGCSAISDFGDYEFVETPETGEDGGGSAGEDGAGEGGGGSAGEDGAGEGGGGAGGEDHLDAGGGTGGEDGFDGGGTDGEDAGPPLSCGDGNTDAGEQCDDGNRFLGDGCEPDCTFTCTGNAECDDGQICNGAETCNAEHRCEPGENLVGDDCPLGDGGTGSCGFGLCIAPDCGDGEVDSGEDCDDGGESDSCNADCTPASCGDGKPNATAGEECDDGDESFYCNADCTGAACGDGTINATAGEQCDDGNLTVGDGCEPDCSFTCDDNADCDDGEFCNGDETCGDEHVCEAGADRDDESCSMVGGGAGVCRFGLCVPPGCGNGVVDDGEECDESGESADCDADCTEVSCGDGVTNSTADEVCDDGNTSDCDGCRGDCSAVETGCNDGFTCGAEACDDGNNDDCDGCRGDCSALETGCGDGFTCGAEACDDANTDDCDGCRGDCSGLETGCNDGFTCGAEACDDGNNDDCDGCRGDCGAVETGCGDGSTCEAETCDDGNTDDCDGCRGDCSALETGCGDGFTCGAEACDDANTDDCDGCRGDCSAPETGCGDGFTCGAEACDDGNTDDCDGCRGDCTALETGCGDGFTCGAEACDDANTDDCDGCHGDCSALETGCGDGFTCGVEVCDDGNTDDCDGCRGDCSATETGCGDGFVCDDEQCDGTNLNGHTCDEFGLPYGVPTCLDCQVVSTGCGDCGAVEDFESGTWPWSPWVEASSSGLPGTVDPAYAHSGSGGLYYSSNWHYRTDFTFGTVPGQTLYWWVNTQTNNGRAYFGFSATAAGTRTLTAAPNTDEFCFMDSTGWGYTIVATVPQSYTLNTWYKVVVEYLGGGGYEGRLYASDGVTLINSLFHDYGSASPGGVAMRTTYFAADDIKIPCGEPRNLLIVYGNASDSYLTCVIEGLTPYFGTVTAISGVPTEEDLDAHDAVLVYNNGGHGDSEGLGNALADFFDEKGHVVEALYGTGDLSPMSGRWADDGYRLLSGSYISDRVALGEVAEPESPLMADINAFAATRSVDGSVINGGIVVASYDNGMPIVVRSVKNGHNRVDLGMFPGGCYGGHWTGNGFELMRNALKY